MCMSSWFHKARTMRSGNAKPPAAERAPALGGFADIEDGLTRVRDDAPVIDDACAANANLPNLSGFEEGSLATMLPGKPPDNYDVFGDGSTAKYIPAGAKLRFQIHYAKVDQPGTDRTSVGLYVVAKAPEKPLRRVDLRNRFFLIPAGARNHEVKRCYDVEQDKLLVAITPHMHYRGKDATYELVHADGRREILLVVPHYDFNWQLQYRLREGNPDGKGQPDGSYVPLRQQSEQSRESGAVESDSLGRPERGRNDGHLDRDHQRIAGRVRLGCILSDGE